MEDTHKQMAGYNSQIPSSSSSIHANSTSHTVRLLVMNILLVNIPAGISGSLVLHFIFIHYSSASLTKIGVAPTLQQQQQQQPAWAVVKPTNSSTAG
jgi:hypothetical protein